jgi:glutathione S-transferase
MPSSIKLYAFPLSGHSHRVELMLSLLGLPFERIPVDLLQRAQKRPEFLAKNPLGQVPVLEDGDITLADSNAILVYLALRYDPDRSYLPQQPLLAAQVQRWLSLAAGELARGPARLRLASVFGREVERSEPEQISSQLLSLLETSLSGRAWLVGDARSVADVALYTYVAHAPEGGVSLETYPAVRAWLGRVEALPGFVGMQRWAAAS